MFYERRAVDSGATEKAAPSAPAPLPVAALAEIGAANRHARAVALSCDPALRSFLAGVAADTLLETLSPRGHSAGSEVLDSMLFQLDPDGERAHAASSAPGGVSAGLVPTDAATPRSASPAAAVVQPRHGLLAVLRGPAQVLEAATRERVAGALAGAPPADLGENSIMSGVSLLGSASVPYLDSAPAIERRRLSFEAFRALSLVFLRAVVEDAGQVRGKRMRGSCFR